MPGYALLLAEVRLRCTQIAIAGGELNPSFAWSVCGVVTFLRMQMAAWRPEADIANPHAARYHLLANTTAQLVASRINRRGRSMVLKYRGFHIWEADDWQPGDSTDFGFWMDFYVGDAYGSDAFTVLVCSPSWFARERGGEVTSGRNVIFMPRFDRNDLDDFLKAKCAEESGKSVETAMLKIDGIGEWEYRYRS